MKTAADPWPSLGYLLSHLKEHEFVPRDGGSTGFDSRPGLDRLARALQVPQGFCQVSWYGDGILATSPQAAQIYSVAV